MQYAGVPGCWRHDSAREPPGLHLQSRTCEQNQHNQVRQKYDDWAHGLARVALLEASIVKTDESADGSDDRTDQKNGGHELILTKKA
jgi:hypothetical protein